MSPTTLDRDNRNALQLFDCHCHCLGEYLSLTNLDAEKLTWLVESFLGSLHVGDIAVLEEYIVRQRSIAVTEMISGLVDLVPGLQPVIWSRARLPHFEQTWQESKHKLDPEIVSFWSGWRTAAALAPLKKPIVDVVGITTCGPSSALTTFASPIR